MCHVIPEAQVHDPEDHYEDAAEDQDAEELVTESVDTLQRFPLTEKNLHLLAMSTNSKGPKIASVQSLRSGSSADTRSISTTSEGFENRALDNGVLDAVRSGKQEVVESDVKKKLLASRGSASPTQSQYNKFADRIVEASNEQGTIAVYSKYIFQDTEDTHFDIGYRRKEDKMWTEFPKNVGFNNGLSAPKPDMIEGFSRDTFPPTIEYIKASRLVRDEPRYVALPHMAVEYKAREKSLHEAKVQAGYDGAAMVYGRNEALRYIGKADPPRQPAVLTATTIGQEWNVYGHYAHPNDSTGREEYYQCRMAGGSMENLTEYKQGRKVLRNMQDFAREQSSDLRDSMQKDYAEHGSRQLGQHSGNKTGSNSVASKSPSVGSDRNGQQHPRGQVTPKPASNNGSSTSAPRDSHSRQRGQVPPEIPRQQAAKKSEDPPNKSKSDASPLSPKQMMPPPAPNAQPHKPSTTIPGIPGASEAPRAHEDSPVPGPPRRSPSGPGGGAQSPLAQPKSSPRAATSVKSPGQRPLPSGSSSSSTSGRSSGSTPSASSADARRHRMRDEEEQKDLSRRRSDSPEKNRPPRPQDSRPDGPQKKSSVFGRFGMGKRKDGRLGDD